MKRMITAIFAVDDPVFDFDGAAVGALEIGVGEGADVVIDEGALKRNVKLPVSGASVALSKLYETVYIPVAVSGFNPTTAVVSLIVSEPSSTSVPLGSVTVNVLP